MGFSIAVTLTAILCLAAQASAIIPLNLPDTDIYYKYKRELFLRGALSDPDLFYRPSLIDSFPNYNANYIRLTSPLSHIGDGYKPQIGKLEINATVVPQVILNNSDDKTYLAISPRMTYGISDKFSLAVSYWLDGALVDDTLYSGKKWGSFAGYADLAVLSYHYNNLRIDIGRRRSLWGVAGDGNGLMLSSKAMPLDGLFIDYKFNSYLSGHAIIAYLSPLYDVAPFSSYETTENRFLSAHALRVSPFAWWDIVLKESVIYGGQGRHPEPAYIIPIIWYHAEQLNSKIDDNTFLGIETTVRWRNRLALYGEFLLDDYQLDNYTSSDNEPCEMGFIIGLDIFDWPLYMGGLEIEYTRINNYTYNQANPRNVYINRNYPIGHPAGPDYESVRLSYTYHINEEFTLDISGYVANHGEGYLGQEWTAPWINDPGFENKFPSGVVERKRGLRLRFNYIKNEWLQGKLTGNIADIKNNGNIPAGSNNVWDLNIQFMVHLPKLSWRNSNE